MHESERQRDRPAVIVTGSSGLLGTAVIRALAPRYQLVGFDRAGPPYPPLEAECVSVDLTDDGSLRRALQRVRHAYGERIASVIHLAAYYDFSGEPNALYETLTIRGTERLLRALQNFQVEQFQFSSTMLVHRPTPPGQPIHENIPLEGKWAYPQSKIAAEERIHACRRELEDLYIRQLGLHWRYVDRVCEVRTTGRRGLYRMLFATDHEAGKKIAQWAKRHCAKDSGQIEMFS